MRLLTITTLIVVTIASAGCRSLDNRAQREISLLRAEILDLEDQYYALKSQCNCGGEFTSTEWGAGVIGSSVAGDEYYAEGGYQGDQVFGSDCCADCGRTINNGYINHGYTEGFVDGYVDEYSENAPAMDYTEHQQGRVIVDPMGQPFDEVENVNSNRESDLPARHQYLGNSRSPTPTQRRNVSGEMNRNSLPDAEPGFRPGSNSRISPDLSVDIDNSSSASNVWKQTSTGRSRSLSSAPLDNATRNTLSDDQYLDVDSDQLIDGDYPVYVEQIFIDPEQTFGKDFDNDGQQDGIGILIQPLDIQGDVVPRAGELVVSLIDPSEIGEKQRIGLWKYQAYQVESMVSNQRGRRGIQLDLPWQRRIPTNQNLLVFVRYITDDGMKMETSLDVQVTPPDAGFDVEMNGPLVDRGSRNNQSDGQRVRAIPASTGGNSIEVPTWRPSR